MRCYCNHLHSVCQSCEVWTEKIISITPFLTRKYFPLRTAPNLTEKYSKDTKTFQCSIHYCQIICLFPIKVINCSIRQPLKSNIKQINPHFLQNFSRACKNFFTIMKIYFQQSEKLFSTKWKYFFNETKKSAEGSVVNFYRLFPDKSL